MMRRGLELSREGLKRDTLGGLYKYDTDKINFSGNVRKTVFGKESKEEEEKKLILELIRREYIKNLHM